MYERNNGLLSEWRGYGSGGSYCSVLDTRRMFDLLDMEFNKYYWSHLNFDGMFYAGDDFRMSNVFPELVDVFQNFYNAFVDGQEPDVARGFGVFEHVQRF